MTGTMRAVGLSGVVGAGGASGRAGAPGLPVVGAGLRLTRRGRWVVWTLLVGVVALAVLALSAVLDGGEGLHLAGRSTVVVHPGDTVWSIAASVAGPGDDVRSVVDAIERLNDLTGAVVRAGQVLEVP